MLTAGLGGWLCQPGPGGVGGTLNRQVIACRGQAEAGHAAVDRLIASRLDAVRLVPVAECLIGFRQRGADEAAEIERVVRANNGTIPDAQLIDEVALAILRRGRG